MSPRMMTTLAWRCLPLSITAAAVSVWNPKMSATPSQNLVEVRDLHFAYDAREVLKGLSLDVPRGKVTGILGVSGCGKSTLLKLIGGQLRPARGSRTIAASAR